MRIILWSLVATSILFTSAAQATTYKWCAGDNMGCYYTTYKQCAADVGGAGSCSLNPRYKSSQRRPR